MSNSDSLSWMATVGGVAFLLMSWLRLPPCAEYTPETLLCLRFLHCSLIKVELHCVMQVNVRQTFFINHS